MKYITQKEMTLLDALAELSPESSKTTLRSWLKDGRVTVDGSTVKIATALVAKGQEISLGTRSKRISGGIKIVYEDSHFIVIDKPAGLLSVATAFEKGDTAHGLVKEYIKPRRVFVVHRLDQDTSGIMIFALTEDTRDKLKAIFEKHDIERNYTAIVEGKVTPPSGTWQSYLVEDGNYVVHVTTDPDEGQLGITHYRVERETKRYTQLTLQLETGKKNQIRVHCKEAGHPVIGDKKYGSAVNPVKRLCLHAHLLTFLHPITLQQMRFESAIPTEFVQLMQRR